MEQQIIAIGGITPNRVAGFYDCILTQAQSPDQVEAPHGGERPRSRRANLLEEGGVPRTGGRIDVAIKSCPTCNPLEVKEVGMSIAHEFGHVLGLGQCLECDSAMSYSWQTIGWAFVTETDVEAAARRSSASPAE